ncbi:hypothetical protein SEA_LITTLEFELLA_51 [Gordonia phage LittleFella]|nr:hypothetical protein SEA_LITTLEFELLA_51 [Gordonia phage LittleFella]
MTDAEIEKLNAAADICDENGYEILGEQIRYAAENEWQRNHS